MGCFVGKAHRHLRSLCIVVFFFLFWAAPRVSSALFYVAEGALHNAKWGVLS